jgi:hypothetical protein
MKNKTLPAIVAFLSCLNFYSNGQGISSELYPFNYTFVHPSYAGLEGQRISMLGNRLESENSFGQSPVTVGFIGYENYFNKIKSGISIIAQAERLGPMAITNYGFSYNYKIKLNESVSMIPSIRFRRNIYNVELSFYDFNGDDPLIVYGDITEKNWTGDAGLLFQVKKTNFGVVFDNLVHSDNRSDLLSSSATRFPEVVSFMVGTEFTLSPTITSRHSLYLPVDMLDLRVDLNNTFIWKKLLIAGASFEYANDNFYPKLFAGLSIGDYVTLSTLLYSGRREDFKADFRGEMYLEFRIGRVKEEK